MSQNLQNFVEFQKFRLDNLVDFEKCRKTHILNYFLAKIGADKAENEQHSAEILPKICNYPTGPLVDLATRMTTGRAPCMSPFPLRA